MTTDDTSGDKTLAALEFIQRLLQREIIENRRVLDLVPANTKYGFDDLMLEMLRAGLPAHVEPYAGQWLDIGRPDDYLQAIDTFEQSRSRLLPDEGTSATASK